MKYMSKIIKAIYEEAQKSNGLITTKEIENLGIGRYKIKNYVEILYILFVKMHLKTLVLMNCTIRHIH